MNAAAYSFRVQTEPDIIEAAWHGPCQGALRAIRRAVFIHEQGVPAELEWDEDDLTATHLIARLEDETVATARMLADGHIGRVAVLPAWRRRGIATALIRHLLQLAAERGLPEVWLNAQITAMPLYERLRFAAEGEPFMEAGIPHRRMRRRTLPPRA